jgi:hypothetical protein
MPPTTLAAFTYAALVAGVIVFQVCLVAGAPWGRITQGGRVEGSLPPSGRIAAALSILVLAFMAGGVASAAGLPPGWPAWTGWTALGVQALSTLANWITPSRPERRLWGPVTTVLLVLAAYAVVVGA